MDRVMGGIFAMFLAILAYLGIFSESYSWKLLVPVAILGYWTKLGVKTVPVGWKARLLCLGERMDVTLGEGLRWAPYPFSLRMVDCRQKTIKLDQLDVITANNITVSIDGTIIVQVDKDNLNLYFDVDETSIKQGLDDIWDQVIRTEVILHDLKTVLGMRVPLAKTVQANMEESATTNWGIIIKKVIIAGIKTDQKVKDDMELQQREEFQQNGQEVELTFYGKAVTKLVALGIPLDQAMLQVRIAMGQMKAPTISTQNFSLDPTSASIVATILASLMGGKKP